MKEKEKSLDETSVRKSVSWNTTLAKSEEYHERGHKSKPPVHQTITVRQQALGPTSSVNFPYIISLLLGLLWTSCGEGYTAPGTACCEWPGSVLHLNKGDLYLSSGPYQKGVEVQSISPEVNSLIDTPLGFDLWSAAMKHHYPIVWSIKFY